MKPSTISLTLAPTANDAYIAANQTPAAAGDLTLNGVGSTAKANTIAGTSITTCVMDTNGNTRQILFTSAGDESAKTITVYGRLAKYGPIVSEAVTGPNTTATTVNYFYEVTRIAVSAAFGGNVKAGTNAVGASMPIPLDHYMTPLADSIALVIASATGTPNFTAQFTIEDVQDQSGTVKPTWFDDGIIASATASAVSYATGNLAVMAVRLKNNSGTGTGQFTVTQTGV